MKGYVLLNDVVIAVESRKTKDELKSEIVCVSRGILVGYAPWLTIHHCLILFISSHCRHADGSIKFWDASAGIVSDIFSLQSLPLPIGNVEIT